MKKKPKNPKETSPPVATKASRQLPDPSTPKKYRPPIASALAQAAGKGKAKKKKSG